MLGALLTILAPLFSFAMGSAFPNMQATIATQKYYSGRCYMVEPSMKLTLTREDFDRVHDQFPTQPFCYDGAHRDEVPNGLIDTYTRVRRNVHVSYAKMEEGSKSNGGCEYNNDLRWVADQGNNIIYWEDMNYQNGDLRDFVAVLQSKEGKNQGSINFLANEKENDDYVFDFYAKDSILNNLPDFITNCKESGGLVPVVEGTSGILPPQIVPIKDIDTSLFKKNYEAILLKQSESFPPFKNYLIKIDKQDLPQESIPNGQIGTYTTQVINNNRYKYDIFYHLGAFYLSDQNDKTTYVYSTSAVAPPQTVEQHPSLQLGRLWFMATDSWTVFTPNCKPAIYLYPEKSQEISVKLDIGGNITISDPIYNPETGWNVKANPDGVIQLSESGQDTSDGVRKHSSEVEESNYPYLYYEADLAKGYKPKNGWVISRGNLDRQLKIILTQLGLNEKEKNDFLDYWLPRLISKPYYFAGLVPTEDINQQEALSINPTPANIIRVRLIFEGLDYPISVPLPKLSEIKRNGFTVVDWGGSVVGETCEGKKIH